MKFSLNIAAIAAFGLLTFASAANAQLAFDSSGGAVDHAGEILTAGYTFDVLTPISVTELDAWVGGGFPSPTIPIGIWNASGALLTSATISTTSPAITRPSAQGGNYDGVSITPLNLLAGTYTIGEYVSNNADTAEIGGTLTSAPEVSYDQWWIFDGSPLTDPTQGIDEGATTFTGPSFEFSTPSASSTPEPGSVGLLIGMATVGVSVLRRRRK